MFSTSSCGAGVVRSLRPAGISTTQSPSQTPTSSKPYSVPHVNSSKRQEVCCAAHSVCACLALQVRVVLPSQAKRSAPVHSLPAHCARNDSATVIQHFVLEKNSPSGRDGRDPNSSRSSRPVPRLFSARKTEKWFWAPLSTAWRARTHTHRGHITQQRTHKHQTQDRQTLAEALQPTTTHRTQSQEWSPPPPAETVSNPVWFTHRKSRSPIQAPAISWPFWTDFSADLTSFFFNDPQFDRERS